MKKEICFGTPVIDGRLDEMYLASYYYEELPMVNMNYAPMGRDAALRYMPNTCGKAYYLYDEKYLYVCCVVHDETICTRGEAWRMSTEWPWNDDGAEVYVWFSDEDTLAVHADAHNFRAVVDEHVYGHGHQSDRTYHDLPRADWAATIDREKMEYTVEMRIPLPAYVGEGAVIGTFMEVDDRWASEGEDMVGALVAPPQCAAEPQYMVKLGRKTQ